MKSVILAALLAAISGPLSAQYIPTGVCSSRALAHKVSHLVNRLADATVEPVVFFESEYPESVTVDRAGNSYLSMVFGRRIVKVTPAGVRSDYAAIDDNWLLGMKFDQHGNLFVCGASGVWKVPAQGAPALFAPIPGHGFLNDLAIDRHGSLYVTDSFNYKLWKVDPQGNAQLWSSDPLLEGRAGIFPNLLGPNGIVIDGEGRRLWVANTSAGRVLEFRIQRDGTAGPVRVLADDPRLVGADGMTQDKWGNLYLAVNIQDRIARVTPWGHVNDVAFEGLLSCPTAVAFGAGRTAGSLMVCNNGNVFFSDSPLGEGLLRITPNHGRGSR
jgi:sugar lactone lactonase YvrE